LKFVPLNQQERTKSLMEAGYTEENISEKDLVRLYPFGVQVPTDGTRPLLLLKDEKGDSVMPVALTPLEAGVTITQSANNVATTTPHKLTETILNSLDITIESCIFVEIRAPYQYVVVKFNGHPQITSLKLRADEAMSLCLHLNVPLYATQTYIAKSKVLAAEIEGLAKGIALNPELLKTTQKYIQ
jgi:bifunctional DNase/RNase